MALAKQIWDSLGIKINGNESQSIKSKGSINPYCYIYMREGKALVFKNANKQNEHGVRKLSMEAKPNG